MNSVIILGAGNIGSRHLQGLSNLKNKANIHIVDPDKTSLEVSQTRWDNIKKTNQSSVSYHKSLADVNSQEFDVAIISTTSSVRKNVFETVIDQKSIDNIIFEKFLFQNESDFHEVSSLLNSYDINAWVNHARRYRPTYKKIVEQINDKPIEITVSGSQWGIGCNGIHYVDVYGWVTGSEVINWDNSQLQRRLLSAKRDGYVEFVGALTGNDKFGNCINLICIEGEEPRKNVSISTPKQEWIINQSINKGLHITKKSDGWNSKQIPVELPYVSEITGSVVNEIINEGTCALPTYDEAKVYHIGLLRTLKDHVEKVRGESIENCPIT